MKDRRAAALVAVLAALVYLPALWNGWAGDDLVIVKTNPNVEGIGTALRAWFAPYWPNEHEILGLHRPFTILTYAVDWAVSGGATWWFHLVNVLLHALASYLVFHVARAWMGVVGAFVAGLVFAIHPVHVEAVANVVGRAELLVGVGILGAVLAARRMRVTPSANRAAWWGGLTAALVLMALFSKEHAVVAITVLMIDQALTRDWRRDKRSISRSVRCYAALLSVTVAWLFIWRGVVGENVGTGAHEALAGLTVGERLTTMLPVFLDVVRLMVWPLRLASDYAPWVTTVRDAWSWQAVIALTTLVSLVLLAMTGARRWPALSAGMLIALLSLAPTSNVFFVSGVILAERALYLAVLAPALLAATAMVMLPARSRRVAGVGAVAYAMLLAAVTVDRTPVWRDTVTLLADARVSLPTNYRVRQGLAEYYAEAGDSTRALNERLAAFELFPEHPRAGLYTAELAYEMGRYDLAVSYLETNRRQQPSDRMVRQLEILALVRSGRADSALTLARAGLDALASSPVLVRAHMIALDSATTAETWMRTLAAAREAALVGDFAEATSLAATGVAAIPEESAGSAAACWELARAVATLDALRPADAARARATLLAWNCDTRQGL